MIQYQLSEKPPSHIGVMTVLFEKSASAINSKNRFTFSSSPLLSGKTNKFLELWDITMIMTDTTTKASMPALMCMTWKGGTTT